MAQHSWVVLESAIVSPQLRGLTGHQSRRNMKIYAACIYGERSCGRHIILEKDLIELGVMRV